MTTRTLAMAFDGGIENVSSVAGAVRGACSVHLRSGRSLDLIELCIVEALNNAVLHGPSDGRIEIRLEVEPARHLEIEVRDSGRPFGEALVGSLRKPAPGDLSEAAENGHGLGIMLRAMRDVSYERAGDCNVLTFRQPLPADAE